MGENGANGSQHRLKNRLRRRQYRLNGAEQGGAGLPPGFDPEQVAAEPEELSAAAAGADETAKQLDALKDQLIRQAAEFDNFRKRQKRDETQRIELANIKLLESMLPVVDNLDRAMAHPGDSVESLLTGLTMVRKQFLDMLAQNGLEKVDALGQPFDPNMHEAVSMEPPTAEAPENHVSAVFQDGYRLRGRLLRPAMVKVAKQG